MLEAIENIIKQMNCNSRRREDIYPRFYLMNWISNNLRMSYESIGKMFGKDHATVINAINSHSNMTALRDVTYKFHIKGISTQLENLEFSKSMVDNNSKTLESDLLTCDTIDELKDILNKVRTSYYY